MSKLIKTQINVHFIEKYKKCFHFFIFCGLMLTEFLTGCTRVDNKNTTNLTLEIPNDFAQANRAHNKVTAMGSTYALQHLVVNITGVGINSPILYTWDACDKGCSDGVIPAAPTTVDLSVPTGSNRLIQLLAVYVDPSSGTADFYYGDVTQHLAKVDESVNFSMAAIAQNVDVNSSGMVAGRFLDSANSGPSGELYIKYTPPNKPGLIIDKTTIVGGWFQVFALNEIAFDYVMPNGSVVLNQFKMSQANPSTQLAKITFPSSFLYGYETGSSDSTSTNTISWGPDYGSQIYLGYFGPGAVGRDVCYSQLGYSFSKFAVAGSGGEQKLTFSQGSTASAQSVMIAGGRACKSTGENEFTQTIVIDPVRFDGDAHDGILGFRGPFKSQYDTTQNRLKFYSLEYPTTDTDPAKFKINYSILPGVIESGVDRLYVYKHPLTSSSSYDYDESKLCQILNSPNPPTNYFKALDVPLNANVVEVPIKKMELGQVDVVLCTMRAGVPQGMGMVLYSSNFQMSSSGGNSGGNNGGGTGGGTGQISTNPNHLHLEMWNSQPKSNLCYSSMIWFSEDVGQAVNNAMAPANWKLLLAGTSIADVAMSEFQIYTDSSCTNLFPSEMIFSAPQNSVRFYFRHSMNSANWMNQLKVSATLKRSDGTIASSGMNSLYPDQSTMGAIEKISLSRQWDNNSTNSNSCIHLSAQFKDLNYNLAGVAVATPLNLTSTGGSNGTFYADSTCSGNTLSTISVPVGVTERDFYFKPSNLTAAQEIIVSAGMQISQIAGSGIVGQYHVAINQYLPINNLSINLNCSTTSCSQTLADECRELVIRPLNINQETSFNTSNIPLSWTNASNIKLYSDAATCNSGGNSNLAANFTTYNGESHVFIRPIMGAGPMATVVFTGTLNTISASFTFSNTIMNSTTTNPGSGTGTTNPCTVNCNGTGTTNPGAGTGATSSLTLAALPNVLTNATTLSGTCDSSIADTISVKEVNSGKIIAYGLSCAGGQWFYALDINSFDSIQNGKLNIVATRGMQTYSQSETRSTIKPPYIDFASGSYEPTSYNIYCNVSTPFKLVLNSVTSADITCASSPMTIASNFSTYSPLGSAKPQAANTPYMLSIVQGNSSIGVTALTAGAGLNPTGESLAVTSFSSQQSLHHASNISGKCAVGSNFTLFMNSQPIDSAVLCSADGTFNWNVNFNTIGTTYPSFSSFTEGSPLAIQLVQGGQKAFGLYLKKGKSSRMMALADQSFGSYGKYIYDRSAQKYDEIQSATSVAEYNTAKIVTLGGLLDQDNMKKLFLVKMDRLTSVKENEITFATNNSDELPVGIEKGNMKTGDFLWIVSKLSTGFINVRKLNVDFTQLLAHNQLSGVPQAISAYDGNKLLVAGTNTAKSEIVMGSYRYEEAGVINLNTTDFGTNGSKNMTIPNGNNISITKILQSNNGDGFYISGSFFTTTQNKQLPFIMKINKQGALDTQFNTSGVLVVTDPSTLTQSSHVTDLKLDSLNRLVVVTAITDQTTNPVLLSSIRRYKTTGAIDSTFNANSQGNTRYLSNGFKPNSLNILPGDKILITGNVDMRARIHLLLPTGDDDLGFNASSAYMDFNLIERSPTASIVNGAAFESNMSFGSLYIWGTNSNTSTLAPWDPSTGSGGTSVINKLNLNW